jgi:hypothetical protein
VSTAGHPSRVADPPPQRPPRPALVELAAAIMIVSGALSIPATVSVAAHLANEGQELDLVTVLSLAIAIAGVVLGILVRYGRAWIAALNVMVIAGFLELMSGAPGGIVFGVLDTLVVVILFVNRPWFQWPPRDLDESTDLSP